MARPLRDDFPGALQHVTARGNRRQPLFVDEADFVLYLQLLGGIVEAKGWRLHAYCLMPNHVHLLIETPDGNLSRGMQHLHGLYARIFNDRHGFVGHLFQGRFGSKLVRDDRQWQAVIRYIALNPVKAGLVAAAEDWEWSSYPRFVARHAPRWLDVRRVLDFFAAWGAEPVRRYRELVSGALLEPG